MYEITIITSNKNIRMLKFKTIMVHSVDFEFIKVYSDKKNNR